MAPKPKDSTANVTDVHIKIFAVSKKYKEKPFLSTPAWDNTKQKYITGQEDLTSEQLVKQPFVIEYDKHYMVQNNSELNLQMVDDKYIPSKDLVMYNYFLTVPNIAPSKKELNEGEHDFYMENIEEDARKVVKSAKNKAKAYAKIETLATLKDMIDLLFFFGENAINYSNSRAEATIYEKCENSPEAVINYFEDIDNNSKIVFIKKCLAYQFLSKATNGYIMYGQVALGADEKEASAFVYSDKNNAVFVPLKDMLDKKEGVK